MKFDYGRRWIYQATDRDYAVVIRYVGKFLAAFETRATSIIRVVGIVSRAACGGYRIGRVHFVIGWRTGSHPDERSEQSSEQGNAGFRPGTVRIQLVLR